jgi:heme oxygenase (biliverdin-producing, ferredoxin)
VTVLALPDRPPTGGATVGDAAGGPKRLVSTRPDSTRPLARVCESLASCPSPRAAHVALLQRLHPVYAVLARAARTCLDDRATCDRVTRLTAVAEDLAALTGPGWRDGLRSTPATTAYVNRLREVAFTWPGALAVHLEARVLADLLAAPAVERLLRPASQRPAFPAAGRTDDAERALADLVATVRRRSGAGPEDAAPDGRLAAEAQLAARLTGALLDEIVAEQRDRSVAAVATSTGEPVALVTRG